MNVKLKSVNQRGTCRVVNSFSTILKAGGMRLFVLVVTLFFSLQSCEEKEELEEIKPTPPGLENPGYSSIAMEGYPEKRGIIKKGHLFGVPVRYEEVDGMAIFEGDILFNPAQLAQGESIENGRTSGAGNAAADHLWPNNTVYYSIDAALPDKQRVTDAILMWDVYSNLTFIESSSQPNRIKFVPSDGCFSFIGMIGGVQEIRVGPLCQAGNVMHEIGHAIGLFHEHTRSDRDRYIGINWSNIHDSLWYAFDKYEQRVNEDGIVYFMGFDHGQFDFGSIMMYGRFAFAQNTSIPTITKKDGTTYDAQRTLPSQSDLAIINDMYPKPFVSVTGPMAQDISVGANGTTYIISKDFYNSSSTNPYGYSIYKWLGNGLGWTKETAMGAIAMDIAPDGTPWVVTKTNQIFRKVGNTWEQVPGSARDIGIGADGTVWIIGTTPVTGGYRVSKKSTSGWTPINGSGGVSIDVTADGNPWVITADKQIYRKQPNVRYLTKVIGWGYEITGDSNNGVYMLSGMGTNHSVYKWTGSKWLKQPGQGVKISAGQASKPWIVKADGTIYRRD